MACLIHVVLGAIVHDGRLLVARRNAHAHQGGKLELPGGKVEPDESPEQALRRELREELGVTAGIGAPVIRFEHDYGDRHLLLDVREARIGNEPPAGSEVQWRVIEDLSPDEFPPANRAILNALRLPREYAITPAAMPVETEQDCKRLLAANVRLILLRAKEFDDESYRRTAVRLVACAREAGARLLLHDRPHAVETLGAAGVHLSQRGFAQYAKRGRPVALERWFAVSCHDLDEVQRAESAGADFCVLGPVRDTPGHGSSPGRPMGFPAFGEIAAAARIPVYALGGMNYKDLAEARARGAQGIAGIRGFAGL